MSPLKDLFFHSDWGTQWQGQVLGPVNDNGHYWLVQTFSWLDGTDSLLRVTSVHSLSDWTFYQSSEEMNRYVDQARTRWAREEKEAMGE